MIGEYDVSNRKEHTELCHHLYGTMKEVDAHGGGTEEVCEVQLETHEGETGTAWVYESGPNRSASVDIAPDEMTFQALATTDFGFENTTVELHQEIDPVLRGDDGKAVHLASKKFRDNYGKPNW